MPKIFKEMTCVLVALAVAFGIITAIAGCDDDKNKPVYHWKVYQEKADGSYILWTMKDKPEQKEGFACWDEQNGTRKCVTGSITIESFKVGEK